MGRGRPVPVFLAAACFCSRSAAPAAAHLVYTMRTVSGRRDKVPAHPNGRIRAAPLLRVLSSRCLATRFPRSPLSSANESPEAGPQQPEVVWRPFASSLRVPSEVLDQPWSLEAALVFPLDPRQPWNGPADVGRCVTTATAHDQWRTKNLSLRLPTKRETAWANQQPRWATRHMRERVSAVTR